MSVISPIPTYDDHASVLEFTFRGSYQNIPLSYYLHFLVVRGSVWDEMNAPPSYGDWLDQYWTSAKTSYFAANNRDFVAVSISLHEVLDTELAGDGTTRTVLGDGATVPLNQTSLTNPDSEMMPSYVSVYVQKRSHQIPNDVVGSVRFGFVPESFTEKAFGSSRLTQIAKNYYQGIANGLIVSFPTTEPVDGNEISSRMGILKKKDAIGTASPWLHTYGVDEMRVRYGLGTQNTRKRVRNTYTI